MNNFRVADDPGVTACEAWDSDAGRVPESHLCRNLHKITFRVGDHRFVITIPGQPRTAN